ncbi:hypothetical protein CTEN210_17040 [Chaetoceros tenuissimus]|uniref:Major facilitator superfamily (MFS) profile domain-containing protein n=1 Tax=Chaetoceros tenuissimus TaxID=426638 RepID=A0AAD3D9Z7_9STRA|nr:hypothetical protein CTEN210_17040 [Chaetoceros tenuissimus]
MTDTSAHSLLISEFNTNLSYDSLTLLESNTNISYGEAQPSMRSMRSTKSRHDLPLMTSFSLVALLSTAFSYGCIMTTLFLLTLPIECQRIEQETSEYSSVAIRKSIALGIFAAIAGVSQLVSPIIGLISDKYEPKAGMKGLGKRLPYLVVGTIMVVFGMLGQLYASSPIHRLKVEDNTLISSHDNDLVHVNTKTVVLGGAWIRYALFFTIASVGFNISYTVMMAMIPDYVHTSQTGSANGALGFMVVAGSLFGFSMFNFLGQTVLEMYKLYAFVATMTGIITFICVIDRERMIAQWYKEHDILDEEDMEKLDKETEQQQKEDDDSVAFYDVPSLFKLLVAQPLAEEEDLLSAFSFDISEHRDFFIVTISRFFYYLGISTQTFFLYFIHDELKHTKATADPEAAVALLAMMGQSFGALTAPTVGYLSDYCLNSRRKPFVYVACIFLGFGNLAIAFCSDLEQMMFVVCILGAANGIYLTMDTSLAVDTLDSDDYDLLSDDGLKKVDHLHGHEGAAQMLGVWGVCGTLASAVGPVVGGLVLEFVGRKDANDGQFYSLLGYETLFTLTAIFFLFSAVSLAFVQKKGV